MIILSRSVVCMCDFLIPCRFGRFTLPFILLEKSKKKFDIQRQGSYDHYVGLDQDGQADITSGRRNRAVAFPFWLRGGS
jgi:hypothetical protein